jgi:FlaG/FlaF family flagellin (archaellin)
MGRNARIAVLVAAIAVLVAAFAIVKATGGGGKGSPKSVTATIQVVNGKPVGGVKSLKVAKGGHVDLTVTSTTANEIHLHGYDIEKQVKPGGSARFDFTASIDGVFNIEAHHPTEAAIGSLEVTP